MRQVRLFSYIALLGVFSITPDHGLQYGEPGTPPKPMTPAMWICFASYSYVPNDGPVHVTDVRESMSRRFGIAEYMLGLFRSLQDRTQCSRVLRRTALDKTVGRAIAGLARPCSLIGVVSSASWYSASFSSKLLDVVATV